MSRGNVSGEESPVNPFTIRAPFLGDASSPAELVELVRRAHFQRHAAAEHDVDLAERYRPVIPTEAVDPTEEITLTEAVRRYGLDGVQRQQLRMRLLGKVVGTVKRAHVYLLGDVLQAIHADRHRNHRPILPPAVDLVACLVNGCSRMWATEEAMLAHIERDHEGLFAG